MYHSVSTSNRFDNKKMTDLYNQALINIGDIVLYNTKFGTNYKYDRLKFIRIKNLMSLLSNEYYSDTYSNKNELDKLLNLFNQVLLN